MDWKYVDIKKIREIRSPVQLLVEGSDPRNFFTAFTKFLEISDYVQVQNFGGTGKLRNFQVFVTHLETQNFQFRNLMQLLRLQYLL